MLKARLRHSLSDTFHARNRTALNELFQLLGFHKLVSRVSVASDSYLMETKEYIAQAPRRLLKRSEGSEKLEM